MGAEGLRFFYFPIDARCYMLKPLPSASSGKAYNDGLLFGEQNNMAVENWSRKQRLLRKEALKRLEEIVITEYKRALDSDQIKQVDLISDLPSCSGVYFVIRNDAIIYIGQSRNLRNRLSNHHVYKQGDDVQYWLISQDQLRWMEWVLIAILKPNNQKRYYLNTNFLNIFDIEEITGIKYRKKSLYFG